jgi:pyrroloquinoline quinone (PQQ) biosynthesis protein C
VIDARTLITQTQAHLKPVEEKLFAHPYLRAVEEGRIARERLSLFAGEQFCIISSDLRSIAFLLNRHAQFPSSGYLLSLLQGEVAAREALLLFARALQMTQTDLEAYEPLPGCQAYPAYVSWLALYGSDAELAAAFLLNLPAWGANCRRMSAALQARYGLSEQDVAFFDLFAMPPPELEAESLQVIQGGLDRGVEPRAVRRAARLIQAYELMYWDALCDASI